MTLGSLWQLLARETKGWMVGGTLSVPVGVTAGLLAVSGFLYPRSGQILWILSHATAVIGLMTCILAGGTSPSMPGLLVWLFMGVYLALAGWASAVLGMAANMRLIEGDAAENNAVSR